MTDKFYGKTWIAWAYLIIFGCLGSMSVIMGIGFWAGFFRDAQQQSRPAAGPPLTVIGSLFCFVALLALARILFLRRPLIRLCREGLEIGLVGGGSLFNFPLGARFPYLGRLRAFAEVTWTMTPSIGFKANVLRLPWDEITRVEVAGSRVHQSLIIEGTGFYPAQNKPPAFHRIRILGANFNVPLEEVRDTIRKAMNFSDSTSHLPNW